MSRSFGDRQFKRAGVTSVPDVRCFDLTPADHFMLLGGAAPAPAPAPVHAAPFHLNLAVCP